MSSAHRPLWYEGAVLSQQHFQQHEAWLLHQIQFYRRFQGDRFGFSVLRVALEGGVGGDPVVRLHAAEGIWPTGSYFLSQDDLTVRLSRDINSERLFLCQSLSGGIEHFPGETRANRLCSERTEFLSVPDVFLDDNIVEMAVRTPKFLVKTESELSNAETALPIGRLFRDAGSIRLDPSFIAPMLTVTGSPVLCEELSKLRQRLRYKIECYRSGVKKQRARVADLMRLDRQLALAQHRHVDPEALYESLAEFCLMLCEGDMSSSLPLFDPLASHLLWPDLLKLVFVAIDQLNPDNDRRLAPVSHGTTPYFELDAVTLKAASHLLLRVEFESNEDWFVRFATETKVAPLGVLDVLISSAMSGMEITLASEQLAPRKGYNEAYFLISIGPSMASQLEEDPRLAVFLSQYFEQAKLSLIIKRAIA